MDFPEKSAIYLQYEKTVEETFKRDLLNPSIEFIQYYLSQSGIEISGEITEQMMEKYKELTQKALRKAIGATISDEIEAIEAEAITETIMTDDIPETVPVLSAVCKEAISYIKEIVSDCEIEYSNKNNVHNINIIKENKPFGRLRISEVQPLRYDYTIYHDNSYKLVLINNITELKNIVNSI